MHQWGGKIDAFPNTQSLNGSGLGAYDVERSLSAYEFRKSDRRCPLVRLLISLALSFRNVFGLITEGKLGVYCKSCRGSMEPAFYRGDILFLMNPADVPYEVGDITVYKVYVSVSLLLIGQDGLIGTLVVM